MVLYRVTHLGFTMVSNSGTEGFWIWDDSSRLVGFCSASWGVGVCFSSGLWRVYYRGAEKLKYGLGADFKRSSSPAVTPHRCGWRQRFTGCSGPTSWSLGSYLCARLFGWPAASSLWLTSTSSAKFDGAKDPKLMLRKLEKAH